MTLFEKILANFPEAQLMPELASHFREATHAKTGLNLLQLATLQGYQEIVKKLLEMGYPPQPAFYLAIAYNQPIIAQILFAHGATVKKAKSLARKLKQKSVLEKLDQFRCDPDILNGVLVSQIITSKKNLFLDRDNPSHHTRFLELAIHQANRFQTMYDFRSAEHEIESDRWSATAGFWAVKNMPELLFHVCKSEADWVFTLSQLKIYDKENYDWTIQKFTEFYKGDTNSVLRKIKILINMSLPSLYNKLAFEKNLSVSALTQLLNLSVEKYSDLIIKAYEHKNFVAINRLRLVSPHQQRILSCLFVNKHYDVAMYWMIVANINFSEWLLSQHAPENPEFILRRTGMELAIAKKLIANSFQQTLSNKERRLLQAIVPQKLYLFRLVKDECELTSLAPIQFGLKAVEEYFQVYMKGAVSNVTFQRLSDIFSQHKFHLLPQEPRLKNGEDNICSDLWINKIIPFLDTISQAQLSNVSTKTHRFDQVAARKQEYRFHRELFLLEKFFPKIHREYLKNYILGVIGSCLRYAAMLGFISGVFLFSHYVITKITLLISSLYIVGPLGLRLESKARERNWVYSNQLNNEISQIPSRHIEDLSLKPVPKERGIDEIVKKLPFTIQSRKTALTLFDIKRNLVNLPDASRPNLR